ncbi:Sulphatase-modifying factor domain protein, partial [Candidatus Magnetomorum sp. HK-1]
SNNALSRRGFVHKEVKLALNELDKMPDDSIFFLPVRLDDCTPQDERLKYLHWGDLFPDYSQGFKLIMRTLKPGLKSEKKKTTVKHKSGEWIEPLTRMEFVWVDGGCFMMGQTSEEKEQIIKDAGEKNYQNYYKRELPRHEVCVDGFWMGRYTVTLGQFKQFINATSYKTDAEKEGWAY